MKRSLIAVSALGLVMVGAAGNVFAADASQAPGKKIMVFYPGSSGMEWILTGTEHGGAKAVKKGEPCTGCHVDEKTGMNESAEIGTKILSGEKSKNTALEPNPIKGKPGSIPVNVQASHDTNNLYLRFTWKNTGFDSGNKMDADNPVKLAVMLEEIGKVDYDSTGGCWATCHTDARTMPGVKDDKKTKYVTGGDVAAGKFFDIFQFRSGKGEMADGYIADKRVMEGGKALQEAKGELKGDTWTVSFTRKLSGGAGDVALQPGKEYNFGFAIHDDHTAGRYHYVSFGYTLALDNPKAGINVVKQ
ncbi:ethylbenzene dehydrogenase [Sulfuricella denitrificans skB26]|uniref:Ethylbenzene dehydrogenase n=1 Tax=Sulfuricella denitrificans (strain DSM 22764 / NBRC 105220 / skB26) TaxID=1163617 RepID=S6AB17_SULDS|nr:ethylbenzene dehydrogenase-related protein [Sulfuricella denitrificans]BAN34218.1 ethylbenzene dehydrogenase [Sulfuricella denitrificans skB26]